MAARAIDIQMLDTIGAITITLMAACISCVKRQTGHVAGLGLAVEKSCFSGRQPCKAPTLGHLSSSPYKPLFQCAALCLWPQLTAQWVSSASLSVFISRGPVGYLKLNVADSSSLVVWQKLRFWILLDRKQGLNWESFTPLMILMFSFIMLLCHWMSHLRQDCTLWNIMSSPSRMLENIEKHYTRTDAQTTINVHIVRLQKNAKLKRQEAGLLADGVIEKSSGPWASPDVLMKKKFASTV